MTISEVNRLIEENGAVIYRFCRRLTDTREDADDLYQETMLRAIEKSRLIESADNPRNYLIGIAAKLWAYQKRRESRRQRIVPIKDVDGDAIQNCSDPLVKTPEAFVLDKEREQLVRDSVARLPERMRLIVYMYYTAELSVHDIAKASGVPEGTVKSRLFKARQMVKAAMEANAYDRS